MKRVAIFISALFVVAYGAQAATVTFVPEQNIVESGDTVSVNIVGKGFTEPVTGGGLRITFDSTVVEVSPDASLPSTDNTGSIEFASRWNTGLNSNSTPGIIDNITFNVFPIADSPTGDFFIGTVMFRGLDAGISALELTVLPNFPFGGPNGPIDVDLVNGQLTTVPVPAAAWLFGSALVGFGFMRGRKDSSLATGR